MVFSCSEKVIKLFKDISVVLKRIWLKAKEDKNELLCKCQRGGFSKVFFFWKK